MSIVTLTQNLNNFNWDYEKASTNQSQIAGRHGGITGPTPAHPPHPDDHSIHDDGVGRGVYPNDNPQTFDVRGHTVTGDKTFDRPAESALVNMESKFGPLNTQPNDRGSYGVTDYMDGTQQGRGFISPGGPPLGFTVDMGESKYVIGDPLNNYTLIPLSHIIAASGQDSTGPHGSVTEQTINLTPVAPNAWAENFMITPLANYVSQYWPHDDLTSHSLTHQVDMITLSGPTAPDDYQTELNVTSKVDDAHGSDFMTLPLEGYTSGLSPKPDSVVDTVYDRSLAYISGISEPNEPIFKQFSRGSAGLNIFDLISPNFDGFTFTEEIPYVIPQTILTGPTTSPFIPDIFSDTPKLEHAHSTDPLSKLLDYPGLYVDSTGDITQTIGSATPSISSPDWEWTAIDEPFDHTVFRSRLYDVYQHHFLTSPFTPISLGTDLFDETEDTLPWKGGSIHIDPDDTLGTTWEDTTFPDSDKKRGVFDNYILGDQFSWTHVNRQVPYGPYEDWLGSAEQVGSIHISPSGQLKAGLRYLLPEDEALIDIQAVIGGGVLPFADLDAFNPLGTSHESIYQNIDTGDYTVPTAFISQLLNSDLPSQRTFNIPASYPDNTFAYSINNQFGTWWESLYFSEAKNHPYLLSDNFEGITLASKFLSFHTANPDWPYKGVGLTFPGEGPDYFRPLPVSPEMREPAHAEGSIFGFRIWSWTEDLPDTFQPYIRKFVGQRYGSNIPRRPEIPIDHIGLTVDRVADDIKRIENWMKSDAGKKWSQTQNFLQSLNPRPETRAWSKHSIILSLSPFIHAQRHLGETYMEAGDFGSLLPSTPAESSKIGAWFGGTTVGAKLGAAAAALSSLNTSLGAVDFLKAPGWAGERNGRLVFLLDRFIIGDMSGDSLMSLGDYGSINLTKLRGGVSLFGRPPKIPSHDVRSQGGPFGEDKKDSFRPLSGVWPGSGWWGEKTTYESYVVDVLSRNDPLLKIAHIGHKFLDKPDTISVRFPMVHLDLHAPQKVESPKLGDYSSLHFNTREGKLFSDRIVSSVGGSRKESWLGGKIYDDTGERQFESAGTYYSLSTFMSQEGNFASYVHAQHQNLTSGGRSKKPEYMTLPYAGLIPENAYENVLKIDLGGEEGEGGEGNIRPSSPMIRHSWRFFGTNQEQYKDKYFKGLKPVEETTIDYVSQYVFTIGKDSQGIVVNNLVSKFWQEKLEDEEGNKLLTPSFVKNTLWLLGTPGKAPRSSDDINYSVNSYSNLQGTLSHKSSLLKYTWRFMDENNWEKLSYDSDDYWEAFTGDAKDAFIGPTGIVARLSRAGGTYQSDKYGVFTIGHSSHKGGDGSNRDAFWTGILTDPDEEAGPENPIVEYTKNTNWVWGSIGTAPRSSDDIKFTTKPYNMLDYNSSYASAGKTTWTSYRAEDGKDGKIDWTTFGGVSSPLIKFSWRFMDSSHVSEKLPYWEEMKVDETKGIFANQVTDLKKKVFTINENQATVGRTADGLLPADLIKRYTTLSYGDLNKTGGKTLPGYKVSSKITDGIGNQGKGAYYQFDVPVKKEAETEDKFQERVAEEKIAGEIDANFQTKGTVDDNLGLIKRGNLNKYINEFTDKINMIPYGRDYDGIVGKTDPDRTSDSDGTVLSDFIKFKFYDKFNDKFIIFRALLNGISDSITPEWSGTRYIGRPDQVYVYSGTDRAISFTFDIYPKTKQEFPILLEKLNYLIGLCYPSFTPDHRMVAPFIDLTLGDMFIDTPGFLNSLSIEVDDVSTWELDEGLQFPKKITCACEFTYIGKYLPSSLGKHYELPWLNDQGWSGKYGVGGDTRGTFKTKTDKYPIRITASGKTKNVAGLFEEIDAINKPSV